MDLPVVGGFGVAALVIVFRLLTERSEIRDLRSDVVELKKTLARFEERYSFQRRRAHLYREQITKMVGYVDLAAALSSEAVDVIGRTPDLEPIGRALAPIAEVLARLNEEAVAVIADVNNEPEEG